MSQSLDITGDVVLHLAVGAVTLAPPHAYQIIGGQQAPVAVSYTLAGTNTVGFAVGAYDTSQPLTIDPVLSWSTYLGGSNYDQANGVALDPQGNIYLTGQTAGSGFPTQNAYTTTFSGGGHDVFVSKLSPDGHTLLYSTYLGGTGDDYGTGIAVDGSGAAYVTGWTWSTNFPTTPNAYQTTTANGNGSNDAFVTKLSPDGRSLIYSSYLGGSSYEQGMAIARDSSGYVYVAGISYYENLYGLFPTTANAYQRTPSSGSDEAFLSKLDLTKGTAGLVYSTVLGGSGNNDAYGLAVDAHGDAFIAGSTTSATGFPISTTIQSTYGGGTDAFVVKINTNAGGSAGLIYGTYLGGTGSEVARAVAVGEGGAYVTGQTTSTNFITTTNALQPGYGGGNSDAFVAQLNVNGTALAYSSYLGGRGDEIGYGIGGLGGVLVTGETSSTNFITTTDALQGAANPYPSTAFITLLDPSAGGSASLRYSSYAGGTTSFSSGRAVAEDAQSNFYITGYTYATDLQGTTGTVQPGNSGGGDAFLTKMIATPDCPAGFDCPDIGSPALSGDQVLSGSRANGTWSIQGSGSGLSGTADQFHYVAQDALGDGSISARVISQTNTGIFADAGLMYRADESPGAAFYDAAITPYNGGTLQVEYRPVAGGTVAGTVFGAMTLPIYLRVTRTGTQFSTYTSSDGSTWSLVNGSTLSVGGIVGTAQVGLAVVSSDTSATNTATFDSVTISTCPLDWACVDLGSPTLPGDQSPQGDQAVNGASASFTVRGAGGDIWGTADQFHFMYTALHGDGSASARVSAVSNTDPWTKAGVMLRQLVDQGTPLSDPSAPYYFVMVTPGNGIDVQYRATEGGSAQWPVQLTGTAPVYVRAQRSGTTFTAYLSYDLVNWTPIAGSSVSIPALSGDLAAGLAVTSHNAAALATASFDYVRLDSCPDTWSCADLGSASAPGGQFLSNGVWSLRAPSTGHYVWQSVTGDGSLSAQLHTPIDSAPGAFAGLTYAGTGSGAPYYVAYTTPTGGLYVVAQTTVGGSGTLVTFSPTAQLPLFVQIARTGSTFTTYTAPDDATWTAMPGSSVSISAMPSTALLGFEAGAGAAGTTSTAGFDTVDLAGATSTAGFDTVDLAGATSTPPAVGTDLVSLDTDTAQYTQAANGLIDLRLYNSPIGLPNPAGWQFRDPTLITSTAAITPARVPFAARLAPDTTGLSGLGATNGITTMAVITSEDGLTLSVVLTTTAPPTPGAVRSNAATYNAAVPSQATPAPANSDLSLRASVSGLDARVVLHSASEKGPFVLSLGSDQHMQLVPDGSGAIQVTEAYSSYDATGAATGTYTRTEYTVQPPLLLDSSTALTAPVSTGPATATLSGPLTVTLSVDPAWLSSPGRVFPATLDLPIVTAAASAHTGILGTVSSCAPTTAAPRSVELPRFRGEVRARTTQR